MAVLARPASSTRTMDVVLVAAGRVVVHDQRNIVDVDASRCDVSSDQDLCSATGEVSQRSFSLMLATVAVDSDGT